MKQIQKLEKKLEGDEESLADLGIHTSLGNQMGDW